MAAGGDLSQLDHTLATLNKWLDETPAENADLRLKITDRILKAIDLRRKIAPSKGKGGKFGKLKDAHG